jgi:hypothetical protein
MFPSQDKTPTQSLKFLGKLAGLKSGKVAASRTLWTFEGDLELMAGVLIRPPVKTLRFIVYQRVLHPELFAIVANRQVTGPGYTLGIRLIPSGHSLSWRLEDACLEEVLGETHMELPETSRLIHKHVEGERTCSFDLTPVWRYHCCVQREQLPPEQFAHLHEELVAEGISQGLLFHYQPRHRLSLAPLSLIRSQPVRRGLSLSCFHTFPEEWTIVKTQSLLEWKRDEPPGRVCC